MQTATPFRQQAERNRRRCGSTKISPAMAPLLAFRLKTARKRLRIKRGHVLHIKAERPADRIDGLTPFRVDTEAQHGMTPAETFDGNGQFFRIHRLPLEFEVKMGRNFPEYSIRLAADPIGHLHRG
ncbi:hypothetical protein D3C80_457450 [compost metagenome]